MEGINDGGPAFPGQPWPNKTGVYEKAPGMTLRDWFAGQVLCGVMGGDHRLPRVKVMAKCAYEYADAMLAERSKAK